MVPQQGETFRHVPSDECPRCGAQVDPDQGQFILQEETPVDEEESIESGNLCAECFDATRKFINGES